MAYYPPKARTFHLRSAAANISGYKRLVMLPQTVETEATLTGASNSGTETLIEEFVSDALGVTSIPAGVWRFNLRALVDSATDVTTIKVYAYSRDLDGAETALFNVTSAEINNTTVGTVTISSSAQAAFTVAVTDRIVLKFYAVSNSGTNKTITLYYQGATNYSTALIPDDIPVREGDMTKVVYDADGDSLIEWDQIAHKPLFETLFLHENNSDIATYNKLLTSPSGGDEVIDTGVANSGSGEVLIDAFVTDPPQGLGITLINGGTWQFTTWTLVNNTSGTSEIVIRVYKRNQAGSETELFNTTTGEINDTTVAEITTSATVGNLALDEADRLVVKYLAKSTSVADRTLSLYYEGITHYSHIHPPALTGGSSSGGDVATDTIWNAKGDLAAGTGADTAARLAVGADGTYLKADSGQTTGLAWASLAGGGDVLGPATSTDNTIARFNGTDNKTIQGSLASVDDSGGVNIPTGQTYNINGSPHTHGGGATEDHDHSGDAGDGGTFDAANLTSGAATDGYVLTADGSGGAAWEAQTGGEGGGAPADAKYITAAANASLSAEIVIPGLAGSADIAGAGGAGTAEEYDTATTGLTWDTTPAVVDSNTTIKSHLYIQNTTANEYFGSKAWSQAGAFDARCKVSIGNDAPGTNAVIRFLVTSSDNSARAGIQFVAEAGSNYIRLNAFTYASSTQTNRGGQKNYLPNVLYFRIKRDASNNISFYYSFDGLMWQLIVTQAFTMTVAKIGFSVIGNTTGNGGECAIDWLRTDV